MFLIHRISTNLTPRGRSSFIEKLTKFRIVHLEKLESKLLSQVSKQRNSHRKSHRKIRLTLGVCWLLGNLKASSVEVPGSLVERWEQHRAKGGSGRKKVCIMG